MTQLIRMLSLISTLVWLLSSSNISAADSTGKWQVVVQTEDLPQRVAIDLCHSPGKPCKLFIF